MGDSCKPIGSGHFSSRMRRYPIYTRNMLAHTHWIPRDLVSALLRRTDGEPESVIFCLFLNTDFRTMCIKG